MSERARASPLHRRPASALNSRVFGRQMNSSRMDTDFSDKAAFLSVQIRPIRVIPC